MRRGKLPKTSGETKELKCEGCDAVLTVDSLVERVSCWYCTQKMLPPPEIKVKTENVGPRRPKGWRFMKQYVDAEGNVFRKGVECPDEKGKYEATVVVKKSKFEREREKEKKEEKLAEKYKKKLAKKEKEGAERVRRVIDEAISEDIPEQTC